MSWTVFILICYSILLSHSRHFTKDQEDTEWMEYKKKYGLSFEGSEDKERKMIFKKNLDFINEHNAANSDLVLGMNSFGHLKESEFQRCFYPHKRTRLSDFDNQHEYGHAKVPLEEFKDWRQMGYVSSVKNQGNCSCCYAFSAVGAIESHAAIKTGVMVEYSEQELVDCSSKQGNHDCRGGNPMHCYDYVKKRGLATYQDYTYYTKKKKCLAKQFKRAVKILSYIYLPVGDEKALLWAIATQGPVSISVDSSSNTFRFYKSGILNIESCSSQYLDHSVLAVGYNLGWKRPYLEVKNSWGTDWGESGYFRIALFKKNMCGIASEATFPILLV